MRRSLAILILLACSLAANAQIGRGYFTNNPDRKFYGGFAAGLNFSALNGDAYEGYRKVGLNLGPTVYVKLLPKLLASLDLLYTQKGCRGVRVLESYYSGQFIESYRVNLNYYEVPVVLHYLLNDKWNIGAGAAYGGLISSKEDAYTDQPFTFNPSLTAFRTEDISYVLDASMQFYKGWFVNMRYQQSMVTIRDVQNIPYYFSNGAGRQGNSLFSLRLIRLIP